MKYLLSLLLISIALSLPAQYFNGYITSDFSGIISARANPSSIANSPYKYDFNVLNGNAYLTNNIGYYVKDDEGGGISRFSDNSERFVHADQRLGGLSFLLSLKNRSAIGVQYQLRGVVSGINITPEFISQKTIDFTGGSVTDQSGDATASYWHEFGLTYAILLKENAYSRLKAGATLKFVNPIANAVFRLENMAYTFDGRGVETITSLQGQVGYSSNLNPYEPFDGNRPLEFPPTIGFLPAIDIGFTYESVLYRDDPKAKNLTSLYPDILYEHRIAVSITDIGKMSFDYGSASFDVLDVLPTTGPIDLDTLFAGVNSVRELRDSLATITNITDLSGSYSVSMPTALNLNYDYNWKNNWYFNVAGQFDISSLMNADYRIKYPNSVTLTPRYDTGGAGLYFPLYLNFDGDVELGTAIRYGPVTLGTHSLGSLFASKKKSYGVFFSFNIRLLKANAYKPYCFGKSRTGTALTRTKRKPLYKRKSIF